MQWLISPRDDLLWLLGSVLVAWAVFALWLTHVLTTAQIILVWVFVFHGPHFWATYSRTYVDKEQFRRHRKLFSQSLVWFIIGPAMIGLGLFVQSTTGRGEIVQLFFFLAAAWAFHHVAKQHFGFMVLYRAKHREFNRRDFVFHKYYLLVSLWMPALILLSNNVLWLQGIPGVPSYIAGGGAQGVLNAQVFLRDYCTYTFWAAQLAFAGVLAWKVISGRGINVPVLLLVLCCVPVNWIVIQACIGAETPGDHVVFVPILTMYHNIQYHCLVWHYNRTKYKDKFLAPKTRKSFGLAILVNKNFAVYACFGALYTLLTIGFEHYDLIALADASISSQVLKAFFWGFAFHHYYLDSKIWHASEDAELRQILGFQGPKKKAPAPKSVAAPSVTPVTSGVSEAS